MKTAIVHVGAQKTASSFVQANLKLHKDQLMKKHGLWLVTRADLKRSPFAKEIYDVSQGRRSDSEITCAAKKSLHALLPKGDRNILISDEGLICHLDIEDFYQNADDAIRYLRTILSDFDVHVILYIRKQADYLESVYMQYVHLGRSIKFARFLKQADPIDLSWLRVAETMQRSLAPEHLHLRTFEQIRDLGDVGFFRDFLSICGIDSVEDFAIDDSNAKGRKANRSYGQLGMQIARRVNPLLDRQERKQLRRFLQKHFSTATHPRAVLLNDKRRQKIFDTYQESNRRLFGSYDLGTDGERLGYY